RVDEERRAPKRDPVEALAPDWSGRDDRVALRRGRRGYGDLYGRLRVPARLGTVPGKMFPGFRPEIGGIRRPREPEERSPKAGLATEWQSGYYSSSPWVPPSPSSGPARRAQLTWVEST